MEDTHLAHKGHKWGKIVESVGMNPCARGCVNSWGVKEGMDGE